MDRTKRPIPSPDPPQTRFAAGGTIPAQPVVPATPSVVPIVEPDDQAPAAGAAGAAGRRRVDRQAHPGSEETPTPDQLALRERIRRQIRDA